MREQADGFILVSALAALALLALLTTAAGLLVRSVAQDASAARMRLAQDALVHAGLESAAYQLFTLKRPPSDITDQRIRLDAGVVTVSVKAESGKVDLNGARPELLAALWRQLGQGGLSPEAFAARAVDWRDEDDTRTPEGAERNEYATAGRPGSPRNGPFETIDELQDVLGVGPAEVLALKPFLTVHNPDGKVSLLAAPREVLRMLPKIDASVADRIIQLRRSAGTAAAEQIATISSAAADGAKTILGDAFEVSIKTEINSIGMQIKYIIVKGSALSELYFVTDVTSVKY